MNRAVPKRVETPPAGVKASTLAGVIVALLLLGAIPEATQARPAMQAGIWLLGALPQGEFHDHVEDNGFGLGGSFGVRLPQSPVYLGTELDFAVYGQTKYETLLSGLPVGVSVQTDNSIVQGLLVLRLQPPTGPVRPYADGLFGFNYLFTTTTIKDRRYDENIASDTNQDDTALAWGGGGGVMIRLWGREAASLSSGPMALLLDLRGRYLVGGEARYLKEGTIAVVNDRIMYKEEQSTTDLVTVGAGVTFEF